MQGTRVWSLAREDPTCCRATKPMCHNYWACALEPMSHNYWAHVPQLLKPAHLEPVLHNERSPHTATKSSRRASLVAQWLRICLPMQGTRVRALVREDPTCRGATKPVHHNYWACALEPGSHNYWAHVPQPLKPAHLEPVLRNKRSHDSEKPAHCNEE